MWPGLLPIENDSRTGLQWMLGLGSQSLVLPQSDSLILFPMDAWALQWYLTVAPFAIQPYNTALPWMMQSHGTQGHLLRLSSPQPCHPLLGYKLQRTLLRLWTVSVGDSGGSLLLQYLPASHVFSLVRLHTKYQSYNKVCKHQQFRVRTWHVKTIFQKVIISL